MENNKSKSLVKKMNDEYLNVQERNDEEINSIFEQIQTHYISNYFPDELIEELELEAKKIEQDTFFFKFINHLTEFSYNNEIAHECLLYAILSAITKDLNIMFDNKKVYNRLHFCWQQDPSSGKGEAFIEIEKILKKYNEVTDKKLIIYKPLGSETIETFYNHYESDGKHYKFTNLIPGLLEKTDIMYLEECSYLLCEKRGQKQTKSEIFLTGLEGKEIEKTLVSWNGRTTTTKSNFIFIGSTRPIPEVQEAIITSGLLQRMIPYFRTLTQELSDEMLLKDIERKNNSITNDEMFENKRKNLALELINFRNWIKQNPNFKYEHETSAKQLIAKNVFKLKEKIYENLNKWEFQTIAESFLRRFLNLQRMISILHAALRKSNIVSLIDIEKSFDIFLRIMKDLLVWIEQNIIENPKQKWRRQLFKNYVLKLFTDKTKTYKFNEFVKMIVQKTGYSYDYCSILLKRMSNSQLSDIKILNKMVMYNGDKTKS